MTTKETQKLNSKEILIFFNQIKWSKPSVKTYNWQKNGGIFEINWIFRQWAMSLWSVCRTTTTNKENIGKI